MNHPLIYIEFAVGNRHDAADFYHKLFGWTTRHYDDEFYSIYNAGNIKGGFNPLEDAMAVTGRPFFDVYSEDIAADLTRAKKLGATIIQPRIDIGMGEAFGMFTDLDGNRIGLFETILEDGTIDEAGKRKIVHVEMPVSDMERAGQFYQDLFGWEYRHLGDELGTPYTPFETGWVGGAYDLFESRPEPFRDILLVYVQSADISGDLTRAEELGAEHIVNPVQIPDMGTYAIIRDPWGNLIALWDGKRWADRV